MAADLDGAAARVGMWLRSTVPGDLARAVGDPAAAVRTDDVAAVLDALDAAQRSAATERAQREAAEGECARLRAAIKTQAAAVRALDASRAAISQHEQRVLRSVAGQDRAAVLAQVDEARAEAATWNARATAMESDRDAAVARREALAGAVRREREAEAYHREAVAECERCLSKPRAWWDRAKLEEERAAASLEDARRTLRAALDALLTEGTRSVADEAECDDCGDDMASGYFDPMARCPRHRP